MSPLVPLHLRHRSILTGWSNRLNQNGPERIKLEAEINRLELQAGRIMDGIDESIHNRGSAELRQKWRNQLEELDVQISELRKKLDGF